jgi:hypothetical protein
MNAINGIAVHQTATKDLKSALNGATSGTGAHFYIDLDGKIYQTASLNKMTNHIGNIKPRCIAMHTCSSPEEEKNLPNLSHLADPNRSVRLNSKNHSRHATLAMLIALELKSSATTTQKKEVLSRFMTP